MSAESQSSAPLTPAAPPRRIRMDWKTGLPKPTLRGWIHTVAAPVSMLASLILVILAPTVTLRWACAVYLLCSLVLFANSAVYHMGAWERKVDGVLRRIDHANIFLLIAGTYTPIVVAALPPESARDLLLVVWIGALLGVLARIFWFSAPRWLYTPIYVILGWVAVFYFWDLWYGAGQAVVWLILAGGLCYTAGALVYIFKWPNPNPRVFGFHEIFHSFTVAAWICQCVAAYLAVLGSAGA